MYFVVFIENLKRNVVLPASWVKDVASHFEKFMNKSINCSQKQLCYYTSNPDAFGENDCPKSDWEPRFDTMVAEVKDDDSFDGCFTCLLKQFKSKF